MPFTVREEVLNVVLADLLQQRGLLSVPESIIRSVARAGRRLPDITIADLFGIRIVIEGRIDANPAVRNGLLQDARKRVEEGISPICLAALYSPELREFDSMPRLKRALERATLIVRVISEGDDGNWAQTNVDGMTDILRRSYELLVSEDVVVTAVQDLEAAIDNASGVIGSSRASAPRLRKLLGIPGETDGKEADD